MFQLSQESSVIYQEAIPVHFDDEYSYGGFGGVSSRRKVYRYYRTRTTTTATSRSNENISRVYISKHVRNGDDGVPARKMMALREFSSSSQGDFRLQVSCTSRSPAHKVDRPSCGPGPPTPTYNNWAIAKKGSVRNNGEVLKRSRIQTAYELSQDLQDKRIEMLERKYGGAKARMAALTIQRAFRRYTLLKKFAAITAMAKASEKRLSRRLQKEQGEVCAAAVAAATVDGSPGAPGAPIMNGASPRPAPVRSLSMRERRSVDSPPMPRSQSGCCGEVQVDYYQAPTVTACPHHDSSVTYWDSQYYVSPHESFMDPDMNSSMGSVCPDSCLRRTVLSPPQSHQIHQHRLDYHHEQQMRQAQLPPPPQQYSDNCVSWAGSDSYSSPSSSPAGSVASYQMRPQLQLRKVPPDVPKRTSSISQSMNQSRGSLSGRLNSGGDSGSVNSVQSSSSDSSSHTTTVIPAHPDDVQGTSPLWKRKDQESSQDHGPQPQNMYNQHPPVEHQEQQHVIYKVSETVRKRQYRVGLNLFNKKPERGISYLIRRGFLENSPSGVARFLISRKGLSKQMIGEYLGNLQSPFNMAVLECFAAELDLCGMAVDVALRKFQSYFRMPGEAQKIERLMEVFSARYCRCNQDVVGRLRSPDTIFVLAFAIIMLNTDLHTPNLKPERRMKMDDFIKNLRGIDDCHDIDRDMLVGIYERVKANEFKPGSDHVTQVMKVQSTIVGKKPNMALPHRRLVCYCRLYEVPDPYKKERPGVHQREVFLFNDLLVITKILSKKKSSVTYTFRQSFPLCGMAVTVFDVPYYSFGIRLSQRVDGKVLVTFNARNEHDRCKFAEDLRESVCEMDEMENLRIEAELERQKSTHGGRAGARAAGAAAANTENRDSGVVVEGVYGDQEGCGRGDAECGMERERQPNTDIALKRSALSNSLLDIHEQFAGEKPQRRGSVGSLDSGMSISFQSTSASTVSRDSSPQNVQPSPNTAKSGKLAGHPHPHPHNAHHPGQPSFLGGLFNKRERKASRTEEQNPFARSTEV